MDVTCSTKCRTLNRSRLTYYHVIKCSIDLKKVPSPPSTAVSHSRALNSLSDSRFTRFVR